MSPFYISIFKSSLTITFYCYGLWYACVDIIYSYVPLGLIPLTVLLLAIYLLKIPKPDHSIVERIVGKDITEETDDVKAVMKTVAHRGAGLDAPENSLVAFKMCADKGCMFIEFDITLTQDGVAIVFHDENLERVADNTSMVSANTWDDISQVDISVKHPFSDKYKGTMIPTLDKTIQQLLNANQNMFIDIKDNDRRMVKVIVDLYKTYPELHYRAIVSSFYPLIIYLIRRANPRIVCSMAYRPHYFSHKSYKFATGIGLPKSTRWYKHMFNCFLEDLHSWAFPRITYYIIGLSLILLHKDHISGQVVQEWRSRGLRVCAWTVNSPIEKQHLLRNLKVSYLTDTLTGENTLNMVTNIY